MIRAIAHILLAKLYKKPIDAAQNAATSALPPPPPSPARPNSSAAARGSKRFFGPEGRFYHLEEVFDSLNMRFFGGCWAGPS